MQNFQILFNSALLQFVCTLPELYSWIGGIYGSSEHYQELYTSWHGFLFAIWFLAISAQFVGQCFADKRQPTDPKLERNSSEELDSSFLNRITVSWFTPLPVLGSHQTITEKDLFQVNSESKSEH